MLLLLMIACGPASVKVDDPADDTSADTSNDSSNGANALTMWVVEGPPASVTTGGEVSVQVELLREGVRTDEPLDVTLSAGDDLLGVAPFVDGLATVTGTLTGCTTVSLDLSAPGLTRVLLDPVGVAPTAVVAASPALAIADGTLPTVTLSFVAADGAPVTVDDAVEGALITLDASTSEGPTIGGAVSAPIVEGQVTFSAATVAGLGVLRLSALGAGGCPLAAPIGESLVGTTLSLEPTFLPAARLGEDYSAALPLAPTLWTAPPDGLDVDAGWLLGSPTSPGAARFEVAALDGEVARLFPVRLGVLPAEDADLLSPTFAPEEPGPWPTDVVELTLPPITVSHGTYRSVKVRVQYPSDGAGGVADGVFPLVAFHHAAHSPSDIYDRYTDLHGHWASHGMIVASVDSHVNVDGQDQSWDNLTDMSTFQLAAADLLRNADATSMFSGHVDVERVIVSGHSRGGGASLISLWRDPSLFGGVCFEPVSPLQTPGQDWDDPERNADRPIPDRPVLIMVGADDVDEPWPLPDISYEQTVGPALRVVIHGANHEDTYDADTPGSKTSTSSIPITARHDLDQAWSTAFFYRFGVLGTTEGDLAWDLRLFGSEAAHEPLAPEGVTVQSRRYVASALDIDTFPAGPDDNSLGGANLGTAFSVDTNDEPYAEGLESVNRYDERGLRVAGWAHARHVEWEDPDAELALFLTPEGAAFDVASLRTLSLRVERDCPPPFEGNCPDVDVDLEVAIWDTDGHEAAVPLDASLGDRGIVGRHFGVGSLPLDGFTGVDLGRVEGVALRFAALDWTVGDLWIDDLRFE